ncbi:MAG: hypothetical protein ACR2K6_02345, partial [Solirubrobacterales bacterium]
MSEIEGDPGLMELARRLRESEPLPPLPKALADRTVRAIEADEAEFAGAGEAARKGASSEVTNGAAGFRDDRSAPRERTTGGGRRSLTRLLVPLMGAALVVTLFVLGTTILVGDSPGELEVDTTLAGTSAEA